MKILLVNPPSWQKPVWHDQSMYPITLLLLSSYLLNNGYESDILDLSVCDDPQETIKEFLKDKQYDILGFTGITENRFIVLDLIVETKRILPECLIVVGGNHFTFTSDETLRSIREIDVVVRFDGEVTLLELVKAHDENDDFSKIDGLSFRKDGYIIHNHLRNDELDLDKFQINVRALDRISFPEGKYNPLGAMPNYENERMRAASISVGRGCPGKCVYCVYNRKSYRTRTPQSVVDEIKRVSVKYNCNNYYLHDPYLGKRKKFIDEFCILIDKAKLDINWYAEMRVDTNHDLLKKMRDHGCISVEVGIESASARVLEKLKKGITPQQISSFLYKCSELGIRTGAFVMVSLPGETESDACETLKFVHDHTHIVSNFNAAALRIYPGTEIETMAGKQNQLPAGFSWYDREYQNQIPDICPPNTPLWIENLSPEYIRYWLEEVEKVNLKKVSFIKRTLPKVKPFILDWSPQGGVNRKRWLQKARKIFIGKFR